MTPPPPPPQPEIIPRQRRRPAGQHRQRHHPPEPCIPRPTTHPHHPSITRKKPQRHGVLGEFHRQHGHQTHPARGLKGEFPGQFVGAETEEERFEEDGSGYAGRHYFPQIY